MRVSEKTNEIPVSIELLKAFDVSGLVITTDALLTQRKVCQEILQRQADYCLPVKANQKQLYEDIRDLFEPFEETDPPEVERHRFENLHAEGRRTPSDVYRHRRYKREDYHTHPYRKHAFDATHRLAGATASLSIHHTPATEKHRTGQVLRAVWYHKPDARTCLGSRLTQTLSRALDD